MCGTIIPFLLLAVYTPIKLELLIEIGKKGSLNALLIFSIAGAIRVGGYKPYELFTAK